MQEPNRRQIRIAVFAFILSALVSSIPISAGDADQQLRQVKVERKPKLISNGVGRKPFDVTRHTIPLREIQGSIQKDAIPALLHPTFIKAGEAGKLLDTEDRVLGVYLYGEAKAYPIQILNWHELVNDEVGGRPILVTW